MRRLRFPSFFRIFYSTTYTTLFLIILVLLAITPVDHITQTLNNNNIGDIFAVGGVYLVTGIIALFIYTSRLYTNRVTLASIPKFYLPIEDGEVSKNVRRIIVKNLQRSAIIAWESRPRDLHSEVVEQDENRAGTGPHHKTLAKLKKRHHHGEGLVPVAHDSPPWGFIEHAGWSSPSTADLPGLQFETVLAELPNLIEAKAVSLAPEDHSFQFLKEFPEDFRAPPDPNAVALLQRPPNTGLRDYLSHLDSLGVMSTPHAVVEFLSRYEAARFSTDAMSETEFRDLMMVFADLLSGMVEVDPELLPRALAQRLENQSSPGPVARTSEEVQGDAEDSSPAASLKSSDSVIHTKAAIPGR